MNNDNNDKKPVITTQDNQLIRSCYNMTLTEKRLLMLALSKVYANNTPPKTLTITVKINEYTDIYGSNEKNIYRDLTNASKKLLSRWFEIPLEGDRVKRINWVGMIEYGKADSATELNITFNYNAGVYIMGMVNEFTRIDLRQLAPLKSFHSIRLYELLMQFQNTGFLTITVDQLRKCLNLEDKYQTFKELKRSVIDKAVEEINDMTLFNIEMLQVKEGRKVTTLRFIFNKEKQADLFHNSEVKP